MDLNIQYLQEWIGKSEIRSDLITQQPVAALSATLDRQDAYPLLGDQLPPIWHWLYFLPIHLQSEIGPDGHAKRGGFLPPVPLPRRMWAGGRFEFIHPLKVGDQIKRISTIQSLELKQGKTGSLAFVVVRHEISNDNGLALVEEHDIVYRDNPNPNAPVPQPKPAPLNDDWSKEIKPDDVLLFRYSALTFNGHRIHYDRAYVTNVEGYPGLIVHGPLIATMLLDLLRTNLPDRQLKTFSFRAVKPLFDIEPFTVCGKVEADGNTVLLWAKDVHGALAMEANAVLAA